MVIVVIFRERMSPTEAAFPKFFDNRMSGEKCAVDGGISNSTGRFVGSIPDFPAKRVKSRIDIDSQALSVFGI
jgi:hypothetical protein